MRYAHSILVEKSEVKRLIWRRNKRLGMKRDAGETRVRGFERGMKLLKERMRHRTRSERKEGVPMTEGMRILNIM